MTHAAQELVLGRVELEQPGVLGLYLAKQLGVAQGHSHLAGEEVEKVLVGTLPGPGRGQMAGQDAECVAAGSNLGPNRPGIAGDRLLGRDRGRVHETQAAVDQAVDRARVQSGS